MSMECAGRERVTIAHITSPRSVGSTSSSTTTMYLVKYAPPMHCAASAPTCAAWPAYCCLIETTVIPQPAASGGDHTPQTPGTPIAFRSVHTLAALAMAHMRPHSFDQPSDIRALVTTGSSR